MFHANTCITELNEMSEEYVVLLVDVKEHSGGESLVSVYEMKILK